MSKIGRKRKAEPQRKKYCHCTTGCGKKLTRQSRRRHYKNLSDGTRPYKSSESASTASSLDSDEEYPDDESQASEEIDSESEDPTTSGDVGEAESMAFDADDEDDEVGLDEDPEEGQMCDEQEGMDNDISMEADDKEEESSERRDNDEGDSNHGSLDHCHPDLAIHNTRNSSDSETSGDSSEVDDDGDWKKFDEDEEHDAILSDEENMKQLEEILTADEYAALWNKRRVCLVTQIMLRAQPGPGTEKLTEADEDNIRAFKLRMVSKMSHMAFMQMRYAFQHKLQINLKYAIIRRLAILSGIEPIWIDCCINSCLAYTGEYANLTTCHDCGESRCRGQSKEPRRIFCYIPLIPRLQTMFANPKTCKELLYRHNYMASKGSISDVFNSEHYQNLCQTRVTIDGKKLDHKYFSGKYDIAFSLGFDGYLLSKCRRSGPSATPLLLQVYNLPPEVRIHLARLICLGVIPGPKPPKRFNTFLYPFEDECVQLAEGVQTFDCIAKQYFLLRAYNIFPIGDMLAVEKFLNIKGHNGKTPC